MTLSMFNENRDVWAKNIVDLDIVKGVGGEWNRMTADQAIRKIEILEDLFRLLRQ